MERECMIKKLMILVVIPFLMFWHWFEPAAQKNLQGVQSYQEKKYKQALDLFLSARGIKPDMPQLKNNTATALYQMKKYEEALKEFSQIDPGKAAQKAGISTQDLYYNMGNSYFRTEKYDEALKNYKKALVLNPADLDLKKNYELTLKKMKEQQQKQDKNKDQQQDQKDQQKDQQEQPQDQKQKEKKHDEVLQYLTQQEKEQQKKAKSKGAGVVKNEKDW